MSLELFMPFEKNYPELGPTRRLRIPDQVAPHLESVLEHLDRQTQRLGQNYIKAFFAQCTQTMRDLEASCPSNTNNLSDKLNQEAIRQHFIDSYTSQTSRDSNKTLSSQEKVLTKDQVRFYCKSIRDSFEELKLKSCTSSLGAWRLIEKGLATRKVELEVVDIFHEISYGFLKPNDFEFEKISKQFNDQCPLVESFFDIEAMKKFPPLLRVREFISNF